MRSGKEKKKVNTSKFYKMPDYSTGTSYKFKINKLVQVLKKKEQIFN